MGLVMPGKNYVSGPVQSLGQNDVGGPTSVANAEASAAIKMGSAISGVTEMMGDIFMAQQETRLNEQMSVSSVRLDALKNDVVSTTSYNIDDPRLKDTSYEKNDAMGNTRQNIGAGEVSVQRYANGIRDILSDAQKRLPGGDFGRFEEIFRNKEAQYQSSVLADSTVKKSTEMRTKIISNSTSLVDSKQLPEALLSIEASTVFTEKQKKQAKESMVVRNEENNLVDDIYSGNVARLLASRERFSSEDYNGPYGRNKREAAINDIDAQIKDLQAAAVEQAEFEKQKRASDLEISIDKKEIKTGRSEIEESFTSRDISGSKRTELVRKLNKKDQKKLDDRLSMTRVSRVLNGDLVFDPTNKQDIKDVNIFTQQADERTTLDVIRKTQILPDHIKRNLGAYVFNGSIDQAGSALDTYQNIRDVAPVVMNKLDNQTLSMLSGAAVLNDAGIPAANAIETMRELSEIPDSKRRKYTPDRKENSISLVDMMSSDEDLFDLTGGWNADVAPPAGMLADFSADVASFYPLVQDLGMAQKMAYQGIQRNWGITQTGAMMDGEGKRAMKLPPERLFGKSPEYMTEVMSDFEKLNDYTPGSVVIMSDSMTGKNKTYQVMVLNDEGLPVLKVGRFAPQDIFPITTDRLKVELINEAKIEFNENEVKRIIQEGKGAINIPEAKKKVEQRDKTAGIGGF